VGALHRTVVLNVVGLTPDLLRLRTPSGDPAAPALLRWVEGGASATIREAFPAVTCTAQSNYLTGVTPARHGVVANGWYFRDECEVRFWRQSNKLVQAPKLWEKAREMDPAFTCANLFWWFNMHSSADVAVTPRPMYPADGRKLPDVYTWPPELRADLNGALGMFPLFEFWGPRTTIRSTRWIADAAMRVEEASAPTLTLVYLPHMDYVLQRNGPSDTAAVARDLAQVDTICGELIAFYEARGAQVIVLSEYGITDVTRPIHLNRLLREAGLIAVREELGLELLDAGAGRAFAVADHQLAHIYVRDAADLPTVRRIVEQAPGVEQVLDADGIRKAGLDHPRAGELVAVAAPDAWFTYYYWLDDARAPDFARTVDIHRKPGYDPAELVFDPAIRFPEIKAGATLLKKKLGFRTLMTLTPLDASLVRGSHGRPVATPGGRPLFATRSADLPAAGEMDSTDVFGLILRHLA
jgi:predicted AlkP superfamily pyrophosphatase or phosphodiesterase